MSVLLVGSHGYVGAEVVDVLVGQEVDLRTCDRLWFDHARLPGTPLSRPDHPDFTQLSEADLAGVDVIIHLAAYSNDPTGSLMPADTMNLNTFQTIEFARKARRAGVKRFVFASSCSVYGNADQALVDEDSPTAPLTPYARSKLQAEEGLLSLHGPDFQVAALRGATAFGASAVPRCDLLLNEFCAEAACGRMLHLQSSGDSWRPFMPVREFARALVHAAFNAPEHDIQRQVWNVAPPDMQMTVMDAVLRSAAVAGLTLGLPKRSGIVDHRSYRVSGQRFLRAFPEFTFKARFQDEIRRTIDAFKAIPTLEADLKSQRFVRLASLRQARKAAV